MSTLTLSLIQTATCWHDPQRNHALFADYFAQVPEDSQLVVLPEMFTSGFTMAPASVAEPMDGPSVNWLIDSAASLDKVICGSLVIATDAGYVNRFLWVQPNGELHHYDKRHLFRISGEHLHYQAGAERPIMELSGWRIRPFICYDLRFPVWLRNQDDYDLLLGVANWPALRQPHWDMLLRARAIENQAFVAAVNCLGVDGNDVSYAGGSCALDPQGTELLQAGDQPGVHSIRLDLSALTAWRQQFPVYQDADHFELKD